MDGNIPEITVVIPRRMTEDAEVTLQSLAKQTFHGFKTVIVPDEGHGANWARNHGFLECDTEFVLFSDNDIDWKPTALETMLRVLKRFPRVSYCYGRYTVENNTVWSHEPFNTTLLRERNYISTMSLIRAKDFPGFDEYIHRLQDWDLWLTMLEQGKRGIYCEELIFNTNVRDGITHNGPDWFDSENIVRQKHGLRQLTHAHSTMPKP
jgi:glycosyltransferase involved in cell wall biosynthesis